MNSPDDSEAPATVARALSMAAALGVERLDAQLLLLHVLGRPPTDRAWLLAHDADVLPAAAWPAFAQLCAQRVAGVPVAYLVGEKEFHGLSLQVDARVLVPRPDTETLVEWTLQALRHHESGAAPRVLDLGTGSGAIALAIQHAWPFAQVAGTDASIDALEVARSNASRLGLPVRFFESDWLDDAGGGWDLIVSNPPYIASGDAHLAALRHEPSCALVSGADGLDDIRRIVQAAPDHLATGGWLMLEHGHDQGESVRELLVARGFTGVQSRDDLAGIARCSGGIWRTVK